MVRYGTQLSLDPGWGEIHKAGGYASALESLGYSCIWCPDERFRRGVDQFSVLALGCSMMDRMETQRAFAKAVGLGCSKAI